MLKTITAAAEVKHEVKNDGHINLLSSSGSLTGNQYQRITEMKG